MSEFKIGEAIVNARDPEDGTRGLSYPEARRLVTALVDSRALRSVLRDLVESGALRVVRGVARSGRSAPVAYELASREAERRGERDRAEAEAWATEELVRAHRAEWERLRDDRMADAAGRRSS
ncbi:hypothetical protein [Embleya scabrispora]|uniref:hypothetical protein n=1 Tax=Embleya scabrispora TaxID=159449 RepID=UPI001374F77F|nr:hypothetical protein [Embleya scabrispora]